MRKHVGDEMHALMRIRPSSNTAVTSVVHLIDHVSQKVVSEFLKLKIMDSYKLRLWTTDSLVLIRLSLNEIDQFPWRGEEFCSPLVSGIFIDSAGSVWKWNLICRNWRRLWRCLWADRPFKHLHIQRKIYKHVSPSLCLQSIWLDSPHILNTLKYCLKKHNTITSL